jgi:putative PIN family toxin of toxin-antitoxin system
LPQRKLPRFGDDGGVAGPEFERVRAVLDSNVLISAAITRGPAHRIVLKWLKSEPFELIICPALLDEVASVLIDRDRLRRWISTEDAGLYVHRLRTTANVRNDPASGPSLTRDPDDDFIVYLARENEADLIVSGDGDLLDWPEQQPPVMKPAEFERVLTRN